MVTENGCPSLPSAATVVTVNPIPATPTITPGGPTTFCAGGSVLLTSSAATGNQWYKDNVLISGETNQTYSATTSGSYTVVVTENGCPSLPSAATVVTVNPNLPVSVTIAAAPGNTICAGTSVTFTATPTNGGGAPTYQWYNGVTPISGETGVTYTSSTLVNGDAISVQLTSNATCATGSPATSNTITMTVNAIPATPTITPGGPTTFCAGGSVLLSSSSATGNQWYKDNVLISGETSQTYTATTSGSYTVVVTENGCPSLPSAATVVTVNPIPATATITPGGPTTFCAGGSVLLTSSAATGNQWYKDNVLLSGETNQTYTATASGSYTVVVTENGCPSLPSAATVVTVNAIPATATITPGGPTTFCAGGSVLLTSSAATGNQWYKDNVLISGETNQTYTATTSGSYTVVVTENGCPSLPSAATVVTVNPIPATATITPGGPTTFCAGGSVLLTSSAATGNQWYKDNVLISGETSQTYTATTSGSYTVVVTENGCPSLPSAATVVTVNAIPATATITPGGPTTFCAGGSVLLTSSAATGNQWYKDNVLISGETNQTYTATTSGSYTVIVTENGCPSLPSAATVVTVNPNLPVSVTIAAAPGNTICAGTSVTFTATPTNGGGAPTYQWYNGATPISGETGVTYTSSTLVNGDAISVQLTSNATCATGSPATSNTITMTVNAIPATPTITPGGPTTFCAGGSVLLTSSAATGNQWYKDNVLISGETNQTYSATTSGSYTVVVTENGCPSLPSAATVVTVNPIPATATITPGGPTTFCAGGSVLLTSSAATGNQWYKDNVLISGETGQTYSATTSGSYTVVVTENGCPSLPSAATVVTVNPIPATPTITPGGPTTFCAGGSVLLTSSAATGNQWYKDNVLISGETNQTYTATTSGSYTVVVTENGCPSLPSAATVVTVNPIPATATITPGGPTTFCAGGSVLLTSSAATGNQWYKDNVLISGETNQTYTATTSGSYTVVVTENGCPSLPSAATVVTVNPNLPVSVTIAAAPGNTICAGTSVTFTATPTNGGGAPTYQWYNGATPISGETGVTYTSSTLVNGDAISVQLTSNATCATGSPATSNTITMTVNAIPATPTITPGGPTTFCAGGSVLLTSSAATGNQWYKDNVLISGETNQTYTATTSGSYTVVVTENGCPSLPSAATVVTVNAIPATATITPGGPTTFCAGGSVLLTSSAATGNQWYKDNVLLSGETNQTYTATASGSYTVVVTENGCPSLPSAATVVTVNPNLPVSVTIAAAPGNTICAGTSVTFTATPTNGGGAPTYQSYNGATPISGETGVTYVSSTLVNGDAISVQLTSNATCATGSPATSNTITMTVNAIPATATPRPLSSFHGASVTVSIPATPTITPGGPTTFCAGGSVLLSSSAATGNQWYKDNVLISGETGQTYSATTSGSYTVIVTENGCPSLPSAATVVTVNPIPATPTITPGGPTTFCAGGSVLLTSSAATGNQWYKDNVLISGETNQTYSATTSGSYTVVVTENGCPSLPSAATVVTVNAIPTTPTITPGGPTTFCAGGSVLLSSSSATGNQWYKDNVLISGETNQTYTATTSGSYTVVVTENGCPSLPSAATVVTVNANLPVSVTIAAAPGNTICAGTSVTFTATPTNGGGAPTYQWYNGATPISGETGVTYTSSTLVNGDAISVQLTSNATCATGSPATSNTITMTVNAIPTTPTITPAGPTTFCAGGSVLLSSSSASGNQWYKDNVLLSGETNQTYTATTSGSYTVVVTENGCPSLPSAATVVTVNAIPATPTITPGGPTTFCAGGSVLLSSSSATGNQWYKDNVLISGETSQTYTATTSGSYTVIVTENGCPSLPSAATVVTVNAIPATPTITPGGPTTFCAGGSVLLTSSAATGNQWYKDNVLLSGETNQTYTATTSGSYTVIVTENGCPSLPSAATVVTVNAIPATPTITPGGPTTFCAGGSVLLSSSAATGNQWYKDNVLISGETNQTYSATTSGSYTVVVTENGCPSLPSAATVVTVNPNLPVSVTIAAAPGNTICAGTSVTFTATPTNGGGAPTYQWYNGVTPISGETGVTYVSSTLVNGDAISVQLTSNATCATGSPATSNTITMTVNPIPATPTITPGGPTTFCDGGSVLLTSSAATGNQWYKDNVLISGETNQTYSATTSGSYTVVVTENGCPSLPSAATVVTVNPNLPVSVTIAAAPGNTICAGTSVTFTATPTNGGGAPTYQWYNGATPISGETGVTYTSSTLVNGDAISVQLTSNATCATGSPATSNTITMTVNAIPATPTVGTITQPTCLTVTGSVALSGLPATGTWTINPGSHTGTGTSTIINGLAAGTYNFTVTDANGCTSPATANVVINNPATSGPVHNTNTLINYCTIQAAIDDPLTLNGHTISIDAGTYAEDVVVNKELEIKGQGVGLTIVIPATSNPDTGGGTLGGTNVFLVQANNVNIHDLTVDGDNPSLTSTVNVGGANIDARNGIITNHAAGVFSNFRVNTVTVRNIFLTGINASSGGSFNISSNTVTNVQANVASVAVSNTGGSGIMNGNTISNANGAIATVNSTGTFILNNVITSSATGILSDKNGFGGTGTADDIFNNNISNGKANGYGIYVSGAYKNVFVHENVIFNINTGMTSAGQNASVTPVFSSNVVDGQNKPGSTGMYATTQVLGGGNGNNTTSFENNYILNNFNGFYLETSAGFTLNFNAHNNSITGNTSSHVTISGAGTNNADMTCNWWGTTNAVTINSMITGGTVTYVPFLITGTDSQPLAAGFQPVPGSCTGTPLLITSAVPTPQLCASMGSIVVTFGGGIAPYNISWTGGSATGVTSPYTITGLAGGTYNITITDANSSTTNTTAAVQYLPVTNTTSNINYATIQSAINAAGNNDVLQVCAGTYAENIVVNKPLDIRGPNYTINPNTGTRVAEAIIMPAVNDPENGVLIDVEASNVSFKGFLLNGDNPGITGGVNVGGADVNTSAGMQNAPIWSGPFTQVNHLDIQNNIFYNFDYQAVYLEVDYNTNQSFNYIRNNRFENMWEGIQTYAMHTDISDNVFVDVDRALSIHGTNVAADAGFVPRISNNDVSISWKITNPAYTRNVGIWVNYRSGTAPALSVDNNTIHYLVAPPAGKTWIGFYGLTLTDNRVVTFSNNTIDGQNNANTGYYFSNVPSNNVSVTGGSISDVKDYGIRIVNNDATWGSGDAKVTVDDITINAPLAAAAVSVSGAVAFSPYVSVLDIAHSTISGSNTGIQVSGSLASANIHNNVATITGTTTAVDIDGGTASITQNTITSNATGVRVQNSGNLTAVTNNFITNNSVDGIRIEASAGTIGNINTNDLSGNTGKAINNLAAATLAATCNWYGSIVAATVAAKINGNVTYVPYLTNGTDQQPGTDGFQNTNCQFIINADPAVVDVYMTDMSDVLINANLIAFNSVNKVKMPVQNLSLSNAIPAGTTRIRIDLGSKLILNPGYNLGTAPLSAYFTWTKVVEAGNDVIYGDQVADLPPSFGAGGNEIAVFDVKAVLTGTSIVNGDFQVTNHNNATLFLTDANTNNNHADIQYTVLSDFLIVGVGSTNLDCNGVSTGTITVTVSGGSSPYDFSKDNGATWILAQASPYTFTGLAAGSYNIKVRDAINQELTYASNAVVITQPAAIDVSNIAHTAILCNGGTATVTMTASGGTGQLSYTFNGITNTTGVFTGLTGGAYNYSVTDANSCGPVAGSFTVVQPAAVNVSNVSQSAIACTGGTATVTITAAGGTAPLSYTFNGVTQASNVFAGIPAGVNYAYSVTDANSCTPATGNFTVVEPAVISVSNVSQNAIACNGGTATVTITAAGGTAPLSYTFNGVTQASNVFTGIPAGVNYAYSVTDANSCTPATGTFTVVEPAVISVSNVSQSTIACNGGTATVTITAAGGTTPLSYTFNGVTQASNVFTGIPAGVNYAYSVTDINSCTPAAGTFTVVEPAVISVSNLSHTAILCNGATTTVTITAAGGTTPLSYTFNGVTQASNIFTGVLAGTYSYSVTDANSCSPVTGNYTITEPVLLTITKTTHVNPTTGCNLTGSITVTSGGGTPNYLFKVDAGGWQAPTPVNGTSFTFTNLGAGLHTMYVQDANGCEKQTTFTLTGPANTDLSLGADNNDNLFVANGDQRDIVYNIGEIAGKTATPVKLRVFRISGYNIVFNSATTSVTIGPNTYPVDNPNWTMAVFSGFVEFTRNAPITCNDLKYLGIKLQRATTSKTRFNLNALIFPPPVSEIITSNNSNSLFFIGN
ncbi:MAG: hypothetical protein IPJ02_07055 [Chitinophagaceae bacterium]|nr:hypothetical protein [Chitinophagaceae bacterium]